MKLFSCAIIFILICHDNMRLVEGERSRENIFWNLTQTVFGLLFHIYLKLADTRIMRSISISSKLRLIFKVSLDCVNHFSPGFSWFPDAIKDVVWHALANFVLMIAHCLKISSFYYVTKAIFCSEIWHFSTIILHDLA